MSHQLTFSVRHGRQLLSLDVVDGNGAGLEHLVVQLLLLELVQLLLQLCLVELRAHVDAADCIRDLLVEAVVLLEFVPASAVSTGSATRVWENNTAQVAAYMVSSTLVGVSLPCICFMASPARCIAMNVSWLMFADSIAFICCSMVPMWLSVCSRLCSWSFLRRSAAFAAVAAIQRQHPSRGAVQQGHRRIDIPALFVLTFFLAICSCSSIWRVR